MNRTRAILATTAGAAALVGVATAVSADNVPTELTASLTGAFAVEAELELARDNVEPAVCFLLDGDDLRAGDSLVATIRSGPPGGGGPVVLKLGQDVQWLEDFAAECHVPNGAAAADAVFRNPEAYHMELSVTSRQAGGTVPAGFARGRLEPS